MFINLNTSEIVHTIANKRRLSRLVVYLGIPLVVEINATKN